MWQQRSLILALCVLWGGCGESKTYPTAPAPKTLTGPLAMRASIDAAGDNGLDEEDDLDEEDLEPASAGRDGARPPARQDAPRPESRPVTTINGHPEGPRAETFNRVVNRAYGKAVSCFVDQPAGEPIAFQLRMTVAQAGRVTEAKVISGPKVAKVRQCLEKTVRSLQFPPFKGPDVSQTIPFTVVRHPDPRP